MAASCLRLSNALNDGEARQIRVVDKAVKFEQAPVTACSTLEVARAVASAAKKRFEGYSLQPPPPDAPLHHGQVEKGPPAGRERSGAARGRGDAGAKLSQGRGRHGLG